MVHETAQAYEGTPVQVIWGQKICRELVEPPLASTYSKGFPMPAPLPYISPHVPPANVANAPPATPPKSSDAAAPEPIKKMTLLWLLLGLATLSGTFFGAGVAFNRWQEISHHVDGTGLSDRIHLAGAPPIGSPKKAKAQVASAIKSVSQGKAKPLPPQSPESSSSSAASKSASHSEAAPTGTTTETYSVELGVFVAQENAADLVEKLSLRQIKAIVEPQKISSGATVFSVRSIDEFPSQRAAEVAARILSSQNHLSAVAILLPKSKQEQHAGAKP